MAGFAWAAWLDPWSLSQRDPSLLAGSPTMEARYAQAVLLGMAFLQLGVAQVLATAVFFPPARQAGAWITALGAVIYALGYALRIPWPESAWLIPTGALLNFIGFAALAQASVKSPGSLGLRVVLTIIAFGMLLDTAMGLFALRPELFHPAPLGPEDGVRMRMLRLARAAAIALPILTLLYPELRSGSGRPGMGVGEKPHGPPLLAPGSRGLGGGNVFRWGRIGMLCGAIGMPAILTTAALTSVHLKYLLPIPADAVFAGTLFGAWLASRQAGRLEQWGWLLIALSMLAGLLMGLYAFDGPLPPPSFLGAYNDFPRRLARLAHAYCIVLGLLAIFFARERVTTPGTRWADRVAVPLLVAGTVTTLVVISFLAGIHLPSRLLSVGPALVAVAAGIHLFSAERAAS